MKFPARLVQIIRPKKVRTEDCKDRTEGGLKERKDAPGPPIQPVQPVWGTNFLLDNLLFLVYIDIKFLEIIRKGGV